MGTQTSWQGEQGTSHNNGLVDQAKGAVSEVAEAAKEQVGSQIGTQKGRIAEQIGGVAKALRDTSSQLEEKDEVAFVSDYIGKAATQVERLANYLEARDVRDLLAEVQSAARREPAIFLGGLFTLGLVAGRFLKSSSPPAANQQSVRPYGQGTGRSSDDRGPMGGSATGYGGGNDYGARGSASTGASGAASGTAGASFPISGTPPVPRPRPDVIPPAPIRDVGASSSSGSSTSGAAATPGASPSHGSPSAPAASPASSATQTGSASSGSTSSTTTTPGTGAPPSAGTGTGSSSREPRGGSGAR